MPNKFTEKFGEIREFGHVYDGPEQVNVHGQSYRGNLDWALRCPDAVYPATIGSQNYDIADWLYALAQLGAALNQGKTELAETAMRTAVMLTYVALATREGDRLQGEKKALRWAKSLTFAHLREIGCWAIARRRGATPKTIPTAEEFRLLV